ncbi:PRC-barrel domain-containing protein [Sulfitobacter sp. D35]|uniref:PRC-barrel domain-containing protein n=1 Tax=Sulfitobacter sp. D35 TaxID=3083252 RepID=UPI00296F8197|nr:PRC-barrel domain-containing protein [Sulfitobacter sp. D35]MDW4497470.1 PRC-barrel domain-containing protein [Sulfitobacter sp. D35]
MSNFMQQTSRLALVALLSTAPAYAFAQTATDEATEEPAAEAQVEGDATAEVEGDAEMPAADSETAEAPEADTEMQETDSAEAPVEEAPAADATAEAPEADVAQDGMATETAEAPAEEPAKPVEGQIVMQSESTILAEDLIGSNVYSSAGEDVGEIDNLIISLEGAVEGVVIGVGGFLGIGEKDVAIGMDSFSTTTDDMGNVRLVTSATKADLEAAESFITAADQAAQAAAQAPAADPALGTGTAPAADGN